jgi:hypothetical protein
MGIPFNSTIELGYFNGNSFCALFIIKLKFCINSNMKRLSNKSKKLLFGICNIYLVDLIKHST